MKTLLDQLRPALLDPQAESLAAQVQWWNLPGLGVDDPFPVAVLGQGSPLLLLHGFDSSFLEYRRLAPLLADRFQLFIPDMFGFGFSPRPLGLNYGPEPVLRHLAALLKRLPTEAPVGLIGASMGGSVAVELARRHSERVASLLLLATAAAAAAPTARERSKGAAAAAATQQGCCCCCFVLTRERPPTCCKARACALYNIFFMR